MTRAVDWSAVRGARGRLDELAREHSDLLGSPSRADATDWEEIMKKREKNVGTTQTAFRLPDDLLERLDRHVERMRNDSPGLSVNRADVVRMLLTKGLDEVERNTGRRRK